MKTPNNNSKKFNLWIIIIIIILVCFVYSKDQKSTVTTNNVKNNITTTTKSSSSKSNSAKKATTNTVKETPIGYDYVVNTNTKKFHRPGCSSINQMSDKNRRDYSGSRDDLISQGYKPCKKCNP
jgi:DNA-entry nuclease